MPDKIITKSKSDIQRILKCGTAASGMPNSGESPIIEMDMADTVAVMRFAKASIHDLLMQVTQAQHDRALKPYEIKDMTAVAETICGWLNNVVLECENGIRQMSAGDPTILGA